MNEEHPLWIGATHGKNHRVIGWESIAAFDANFAAIKAVVDVERCELNSGAAVRRHLHFSGRDSLAIHNQRNSFRSRLSTEPRNNGAYAGAMRVFRIRQLCGCIDALDGPGGRCDLTGNGMKIERYVGGQHEIGEIRGHGAALHVAVKVDISRRVHVFCDGAEGMAQLTVAGVAIAGLDALERGAHLGCIENGLGQYLKLATERHDLRLLRWL